MQSKTMRIDAHQHFWRYNPDEYAWIDDSMSVLRRDFLPGDLRPELDRCAFEGSVLVQARQTIEESEWLLEIAGSTPWVLGVVGWVDLCAPNLRAQLERLTFGSKLVGVRHIVQSERDDRFLLRSEFLRGIEVLADFDLVYDILIYPKHLYVAAEFVGRFPGQRFVLDHLAKPPIKSGALQPWEREIRGLARCRNVWCKLSGMVTEADWQRWRPEHIAPYLDVAFDCFGPDRLMVGSDWPVCTLGGSYGKVIDVVLQYLSKYSSGVQDAVLGNNAQELWKLQLTTPCAKGGISS